SHGLDLETGDVAALAQAIQESAIRDELVAALDNWVPWDPERRERLLEVARRADPDPWKNELRDPAVWRDAEALKALVSRADVARLPPPLLSWLGIALRSQPENREAGLTLLKQAQKCYPDDFWLNFNLGVALYHEQQWDEAIGYCRAALALRP